MLGRLLKFASAVEIATALAVLVAPRVVVELLLGGDVVGIGIAVTRCFGVALLSLGLACWPAPASGAAVHAMVVYNALVAVYLAYLFAFERLGGLLLWPAVALHAVLAVLLVAARRRSAFPKTSARV